MKIIDFDVYRYALPLKPPLRIKYHKISKRIGFIIRIESEDHHYGYGEVAPLPGISREDLLTCLAQLKSLKSLLLREGAPDNLGLLQGEFESWLSEYQFAPSIRFAIEMAVLNLKVNIYKDSLFPLPLYSGQDSIKLNGLLTGSYNRILKQAEQLLDQGYTTLKVKVGHHSLKEDIDLVTTLRSSAGENVKFRLDSNRAWNLQDAVEFGKAIGQDGIEYIEEPLKNPSGLSEFYHETGIPVALDESLLETEPYDFQLFEGINTLVIKPGVIGGLEASKLWVYVAKEHNLTPVISCAFMSGLGQATIAAFTASIIPGSVAMGLDTFNRFVQDLTVEPICARQGELSVKETIEKSFSIRKKLLERVQ